MSFDKACEACATISIPRAVVKPKLKHVERVVTRGTLKGMDTQ